MKRGRLLLFYSSTIVGLLLLIGYVLHAGSGLSSGTVQTPRPAQPLVLTGWTGVLRDAFHSPISVLLLQLICIVLATRITGWLFKQIGQPAVVGEIAAGIVLGPSVIGAAMPQFSAVVFPKESIGHLQMLSQVGLILFMYVIGMELDWRSVREKAGAAVVISHSSIVLPYGLGVLLSLFVYEKFATPGTPFFAFALFMGIAMSITAFPVLARMIRERGLTGTRLGNMALTCAAADDVSAWCILALVLAAARAGSIGSSWQTILMAVVFVALMIGVVRPLLRRFVARRQGGALRQSTVAVVFLVLLGTAWCSEAIGIHALFGAFLAGVVMPTEGGFRQALIQKIEDVALVLLLPLFFAYTGLRTEIGLLSTAEHWLWCAIITVVAVAGKLGGTYIAARITGENHSGSLALGALMNTRGMMELVVLNIGLELHILSPAIFAMMVLMALATTLMTSPLLKLAGRSRM